MRRCHRVARILLAAVVFLVAVGSQAASLLLPVTTGVPPFNTEVVCRGLQVRDADTAILLRSFPELRCVRTVASAGGRRAVVVSGASTLGDRTDDAVRLINLDDGSVLATAALNPVPGFFVYGVRALDDRSYLVTLFHSQSNGAETRLVRLEFDGSALAVRADATVPGFAPVTDSGDLLTARRYLATGVAIDLYRPSDLAAVGGVVFDQPAGITFASAEVRGNRMYAMVRVGSQDELRVVDVASGALISSRVWSAGLTEFSAHDGSGRVLTTRSVPQTGGGYRVDLLATSLDDGTVTTLGSRSAASPFAEIAHRDGQTVLLSQYFKFCDLICPPDRPLDYAITRGPDLRVLSGEPMSVGANSAQFLGPSLLVGDAATVPVLTTTGFGLLVTLLVMATRRRLWERSALPCPAAAVSRRSGCASPR